MLGPGFIFQLDLNDKRFLLRAKSYPQVDQWVQTLNRIKINISTKVIADITHKEQKQEHTESSTPTNTSRLKTKLSDRESGCVLS